ncbi:WD40-repeat-containing domain protein [Fimicolochytrium jonesii]|uniref:WD40-repeat-containing domain protein n=1 Tax=Fimicolochytrium jonesii TaxID=1396493 RepID=UPI0022FEDBE0|nr:WD40-repeat-containing domain protein [Fimicolochytrium jonesii]KAI8826725.1 WD40-repeat-containing domain protein [Fimicolochytrium jonesii]
MVTTLGDNAKGEFLETAIILQFEIGREFVDNVQPVASIDFHASGELCITSSGDDSLRLYDAVNATAKTHLYSKKYGCNLARFTHSRSSIIYSSTKVDHTIRYHSLHDNRYLRYFEGHEALVVDLEMSPNNDTFLSSSIDGEVRLWDLRTPNCMGLAKSIQSGRTSVAFDQSAKVFATVVGNKLRLYDVAQYDVGPFGTFEIPLDSRSIVTGVEFANDGKDILVSTSSDTLYLINSFAKANENPVKFKLKGHSNKKGALIRGTLSPDAKFASCGSDDGTVHFWETETGKHIAALKGTERADGMKWNPKYMMFATASEQLVSLPTASGFFPATIPISVTRVLHERLRTFVQTSKWRKSNINSIRGSSLETAACFRVACINVQVDTGDLGRTFIRCRGS